jgi:hypothetical protein
VSSFRPPGGSSVPHFRQVNRRRRVYAVAVVVVVLGAIGAGSVYLVKSGGGPGAACRRAAYVPPPPQPSPVNVMNGTTQGGFAAAVADQLRQRGFTIGTVGNDPLRRKIRGTGELRFGPDGQSQVDALRPWNLGMNPIPDAQRQGPSVDFVIGDSFDSLYAAPKPPPGQVLPCVATGKPAG